MIPTFSRRLMSKFIKHFFLFLYIGLVSGVLSSLFLYTLQAVTMFRSENPILIFGLPVFGFIFGILLKHIPSYINQGVPYIINEIDNEKEKVSILTAPFIFIASICTHLFGGSAGREGVGVLMGASAAHVLPKAHPTFQQMRTYLIYGGVAAGFASIFGTPLAGIVFAFELHWFKEIKKFDLIFTTVFSAVVAYFVNQYLGPEHVRFTVKISWDFFLIISVILISLISAVGGLIFYFGMKGAHHALAHIRRPEWKLFIGGFLICSIIWVINGYEYAGISSDLIQKSFVKQMHTQDFIWKCLLTILTLSVGFKGGEVTPLFCMGATLANSVMSKLSLNNYSLNSALGMVSIFAAVTKTPLASSIMACELFGYEIGPMAFLCCFLSSVLTKGKSIYKFS
jgi:H+/Cl- antiporter ClcA